MKEINLLDIYGVEYIKHRLNKNQLEITLLAMEEACKTVLKLASENVKKEIAYDSESREHFNKCIKPLILNTINQIK